MLLHYPRPQVARLWLATGLLLLGACQSPPATWAPGQVFQVRGHKLTYRVEHFGAAATRPFLVDTMTITTYGTRERLFDPNAQGEDSIRQWQIEYKYRDSEIHVSARDSRVITNDTMLWMHPPRTDQYKILELSPFPYIKLPARAGQRWSWRLAVGSQWASPKWAVWQGEITLNYAYQTVGQRLLTTKLGPLTCWLVRGQVSCPVGTSRLDSYYHPQLGFVRLAYRNINGSRLTMSLVDTVRVTLPVAAPATYLPKAWQLPASQ